MAEQSPEPVPTRPSGRVWLVVLCAVSVAVFLAIVLPGVFDVKHQKRSFEIKQPVERLVLDAKGTSTVDVSLSHDGHVHVQRTSSISRDSRLVERKTLAGKTLTIRSSCTGSRLGILRRCDMHYHLQVPRKIALSLRVHFGQTTVHGTQGRLQFRSDAGDFRGFGCNKLLDVSVSFGAIDYRDTCVPELIKVKLRIGDAVLTVPAGRYDVRAGKHAVRPFENIIEDPSSSSRIDGDIIWGGSLRITGAQG